MGQGRDVARVREVGVNHEKMLVKEAVFIEKHNLRMWLRAEEGNGAVGFVKHAELSDPEWSGSMQGHTCMRLVRIPCCWVPPGDGWHNQVEERCLFSCSFLVSKLTPLLFLFQPFPERRKYFLLFIFYKPTFKRSFDT